MRWRKSGEVDNEYTPEKLVLFAIFLPKMFTIVRNLTKFWQKIILHSFFETRCIYLLNGEHAGTCRLMEGGADTGFNHVEPEKYKPRLMHFCGKGINVVVKEVFLGRPER